MSAKHYMTDPTETVLASLRAVTLTNPSVLFDEANKIVYRHPASIPTASNVSVVCGGGSGHEPGFAGYVGHGLLTACVAGTVFASPSAQQIRTALLHRLPDKSKGTLVVATNYTGDVLNFGMGVERARAMGRDVEMVVVADDVGVGREKGGKVGRRGIGGAAIVVKISGALAEMGAELKDCARVAKLVVDNLVSVAASLSRVHVPGRPIEEAKEEEQRMKGLVEIGMGVHNEPGCEKVETNLPGLVKKMLAQMLDQNDKDRAYVKIEKSDDTILLFNNFGGVSNLEMGAIICEVTKQLAEDYRVKPKRIKAGVFFGSLNGLGFGITLLKLADTGLGHGKSLLELFDAPSNAVGWPASITAETWEKQYDEVEEETGEKDDAIRSSNLRMDIAKLKKSLTCGLDRLISVESDVTKFDTVVGDGDCGIGLKRGAEALLKLLDSEDLTEDTMLSFGRIVQVVENTMDGTSGALYAIFLNSLAHNLRLQDMPSPKPLTPQIWAGALQASLEALSQYTPAKVGDRTLMDALIPFVDTLKKTGDTRKAAEAAHKGAETTKGMKASLGRTVYVGGHGWKDVPDPGAYGLAQFLLGLADGL